MIDTSNFTARAEKLLCENILPFWIARMADSINGGFYGRMTGEGVVERDAPKGVVLNARILWTFSAAYRIFRNAEYLQAATRAERYLTEHFLDKEFGGVYWLLTSEGAPLNTKKQFYALAFAIYGLSEYFLATGNVEALRQAQDMFEEIETYNYDPICNGYCEAATREWTPIGDMRLSEKDANEKMSMNTHLHILEAYTNLYRAWPSFRLKERLVNLVNIVLDRIYDPTTGHMGLFFDGQWHRRSVGYSFGHDIEASWLVQDAAEASSDAELIARTRTVTQHMAHAAMEGLQADGSMIYEQREDGTLDTERHWWVQAETVVGLLRLGLRYSDNKTIEASIRCFDYICNHLVDRKGGEWFWSCYADGTINRRDDKAGIWKCPYHNSKMCFEIIRQLKNNSKP